ncbi:MAG: hypothetical protein JWR60_4207 [Polaromonas sp.]|nr:hypothetical protein [Polaromonas sp.]
MNSSTPAAKARFSISRLPGYLQLSDIQGLAQLATQATLGVTGLAENVHGNVYKAVASLLGPVGDRFIDGSPSASGASGIRPAGITGMVYGGVRGVTRLAGGAVNAVLAGALPLVQEQPSSRPRENMLSALNGVLGDRLRDTANPLAIRMSLRHEGQTLPLEKAALAQRLPAATAKVLVLIHGLCMNDLQWRAASLPQSLQPAQDHGELLAAELGYTPVYLHYNTGLHISDNGRQLAGLLEQLLAAWPQPVQELALLGHSMGGLVARSACSCAAEAGLRWPAQLRRLVFLGTPHHGAPLERVGHWVDKLLGRQVVTRPFARIGQIRSAGITDLRHGNVLDADWAGGDRFDSALDARQPLPLPAGVACYTVAATTVPHCAGRLLSVRQALSHKIVGDGLVPVQSALGQHEKPERCLVFSPENQWVAHGMSHMELLSRPEVTRQLVDWLRSLPVA